MKRSTGLSEAEVGGGAEDLQALVDQAIAQYTSTLRYRFRVGLARLFGIKDPAPVRNVRRIKEIVGLGAQVVGASAGAVDESRQTAVASAGAVAKSKQDLLAELNDFLGGLKGFWARRNPLFKALRPVVDQFSKQPNPSLLGDLEVMRPSTSPHAGEMKRDGGAKRGDMEAVVRERRDSASEMDVTDTSSSPSSSPATPRVRELGSGDRAPAVESAVQLAGGSIVPVSPPSEQTLAFQEQYGLAIRTIASLESRLQQQNEKESELNQRVDQLTRQLESRPQALVSPDPQRLADLERQVQELLEERDRLQQRLQQAPAAEPGFVGPPPPPGMPEGGFAPPPPPPPGAPPPPPLAGPPKPLVFKKKDAQAVHGENPQGMFGAGGAAEAGPPVEAKPSLVDELKQGRQLKKVDQEALKREREAARSKEPGADVKNALVGALGKMRGAIRGEEKKPKPKKEGTEHHEGDSPSHKKKSDKWG